LTAWPPPQIAGLPGGRLHLQHGPIDLIVKAVGAAIDVAAAHDAAIDRFQTVLGELIDELALLRRPLSGDDAPRADGSVARRMIAACWPFRSVFITPMAAVAGSVADEIKAVMLAAAPGLRQLYVNNGGDIAAHVAVGEVLRIGLVPDLADAVPHGAIGLDHRSGIGGVATSGWRGRSFSLGVADAATVLARSAAEADAAATIVANAVAAEDPAVRRAPAISLDPDSDLGDRLVTTDVGQLPPHLAEAALERGAGLAKQFLGERLIVGAALVLQGRWRIIGMRRDLGIGLSSNALSTGSEEAS
jgi:ApbE superfamily uncharacterized protein (UPF0280 family)